MTFNKVALRKESVDRNLWWGVRKAVGSLSLSARRAWIEIAPRGRISGRALVALRKESVDRNILSIILLIMSMVALRKESVDRNCTGTYHPHFHVVVALRKESVDRNCRLGAYSAD